MTQRPTKSRAVRRRRGSIIKVQGAHGVSYKLKFDLPSGTIGERRTHYKTIRGSYEEAEAELARLTGQDKRGFDLDAAKQTLSDWIKDWLQIHIIVGADGISMRTFERYEELLRHHVVPYIGHHPLGILSTLHIERLYKELSVSGRRTQSPNNAEQTGLSPRTILHVHRVLFQCLKDAKRLRVIPENPAADVKRRKIKKVNGSTAKMHVLSLDRMLALLNSIKAANLNRVPYVLVILAFDSGARRGELLALRWLDVDFGKRALSIERAVEETKANGVIIKPELKNESSRRTITLSVQTVATLRAWRARQAEDRLKLGVHLPADALIFPESIDTPTKPHRPREVTKAFSRLVKAYGFDGFRFHDFRHSCASFMLANGAPVPTVSQHLGHANSAITLSVYGHAIPKDDGGMGLLDQLMPEQFIAE